MGTCSSYSLMPGNSPINSVASNNNNNLLSLTVSMGQELEIGLVGQILIWDLSDGCRWLGLKSSESSLIHHLHSLAPGLGRLKPLVQVHLINLGVIEYTMQVQGMTFLNINKVVSITLQPSELAQSKYIPELSGLEPEPDVGFPDMGQNLTI